MQNHRSLAMLHELSNTKHQVQQIACQDYCTALLPRHHPIGVHPQEGWLQGQLHHEVRWLYRLIRC